MKTALVQSVLLFGFGCSSAFVASHVDRDFSQEQFRSGRVAVIGYREALPAAPIANASDTAITNALQKRLPNAVVVETRSIEAKLGARLVEAVSAISSGPRELQAPIVALIGEADPKARYAIAGTILSDITKQERRETICTSDDKARGCKPQEFAEVQRCLRFNVRVADIGSGVIGWESGVIESCATTSRSREKEGGLLAVLDADLPFPPPPHDSVVADVAAARVVDTLVPRLSGTEGFEQHDGLFFRATLGGNYGFRFASDATGDVTLNTGGTQLLLALGGSITSNWVLFAEIAAEFSMTGTASGGAADRVSSPVGSTSFVGVSAGVGYYFMPLNVYLQLTGGFGGYGVGVVQGDTVVHASADNFVGAAIVSIATGKEWWISEDWGLGVALRLSVPIPVDDGKSVRLNDSAGFGIAAGVSATFN